MWSTRRHSPHRSSLADNGDNGEIKTLEIDGPTGPNVAFESDIIELEGDGVSVYYAEFGPLGDGLPRKTIDQNFNNRFGRVPEEGDAVSAPAHNLEADTTYEARGVVEDNEENVVIGNTITVETKQGPVMEEFRFDYREDEGVVVVDWEVSHELDDLNQVRCMIRAGDGTIPDKSRR